MTADFNALFAHLGFVLTVVERDGAPSISVSPKSELTPELRTVIERHRDEIIDQLRRPGGKYGSDVDREVLDSESWKRDPAAARTGLRRCLDCYATTGSNVWLQAAMHYALMLDVHLYWTSFGVPIVSGSILRHVGQLRFVA